MRELSPPSWERLWPEELAELPKYARSKKLVRRQLISIGVVLVLAGFLGATPGPAAFGWALLSYLLYAYYRAREAARAWQMRFHSLQTLVEKGSEAKARFVVANRSRQATGPLILRLPFQGAAMPDHYLFVDSLAAGERRPIEFSLRADKAIGRFEAGPVEVVAQDELGFFRYSTDFVWSGQIEVLPKIPDLPRFPLPLRGSTLNAGAFETKRGGDSVNFLSLREWRKGDSTRRIDWRRSLRFQQLLVKDFENLVGTEATLLIDQGPFGHSEFGPVSSIEAMKETALAVSDHLLSQSVRVQLVSQGLALPFGIGPRHADLLREAISSMHTSAEGALPQILREALPTIPAGSLVAVFITTAGATYLDWLSGLIALQDRGVQVCIFAFDSVAFANRARYEASLPPLREAPSSDFQQLLAHLPNQVFVLQPGQDLAEQLAGRR